MKILIDTNVLFTYLTKREDKYVTEANVIMDKCVNSELEGFVAFHSLSTVWYLLRHTLFEQRIRCIEIICNYLRLSSSDNELLKKAIKNTDFRDFEDNLQDCCAQSVGADYIVTANVRDYEGHSVVKAVTPSELLDILDDEDSGSLEVREQSVAYEPFGGVSFMKPHWHIAVTRRSA